MTVDDRQLTVTFARSAWLTSRPSAFACCTLLIVLLPGPALGRCDAWRFSVWPADGRLPANGRIVLTGHAATRTVVRALKDRHPRLDSIDGAINLKIDAIYEGEYGLTQAVLTPRRKLSAGTSYLLRIQGIPFEQLMVDDLPITFRAVEEDRTPPRWVQMPKYQGGSREESDCGPSVEVRFGLLTTEETIFLIALHAPQSEEPVRFLVDASDRLYIGHGVCSGAFVLEQNAPYRAVITAFDAAANRSTSAEVHLVGPKSSRVPEQSW